MRCVQGGSIVLEGFNRKSSIFYAQNEEGLSQNIVNLNQISDELEIAMKHTTAGKFGEALTHFGNVLLSCLFIVAQNDEEEEQIHGFIGECREYILGLLIEQARKECLQIDESCSLTMACYFTLCGIRREHLILALRSALTQAYKLQCIALAGKLARRLLQADPPESTALQAKKVVALADKLPLNHIDPIMVQLGDQTRQRIDCATFSMLDANEDGCYCPYCHAVYKREHFGSVCSICKVSQVGRNATGLVCRN